MIELFAALNGVRFNLWAGRDFSAVSRGKLKPAA
jgi:hypothetical protein